MMPLPDASTERLSLTLDPVLDLRAAASLKVALLQGLERQIPLLIDAGQVTRMSTACVQLLAACMLDARNSGRGLGLGKSSAVFDAAFADLGLASILDGVKIQERT